MKSFLDFTFTYWMSHRPRKCMFSKKAVVVSTAAGSGARTAVRDVARLAKSLGKRQSPPVGIKTRFMFRMMAGMQSAGWGSSPIEKEYWEDNGWLGKKRPWK